MESAVVDWTQLFEQPFDVLTSLQGNSNIWRIEMEAHKLQWCYDEFKGTAQIVTLTQRLSKRQVSKKPKEQVDTTLHKEVVLMA